ncbi:intercompartmental signaling factor BofC [Lederbergia sp. NSJ-179]|uniref:intercompartmental signaling factor BofC n=1 Tax=Lederbergia sp. NSJ-179 TaxID=2931402 RepID=UPI001FD0C1C1|nr:intercompartmental signaling factor BofC [Lederbergia sp. NSJ-179]MCJ7839916.1 intercompartmental signaling factor BofC [Lederbergia sp. NSJ-179]
MNFTGKLLISFVILMGTIVFYQPTYPEQIHAKSTSVEQEETPVYVPESPLEIKVVLKRKYLDGDVSEEVVKETIWALEDFWAKYETWRLVDIDEKQVIFQKSVNDISPLLKVNGFFGLQEDGTLSIFNGSPDQSDIIHSFFQIDIEKLEGKKREELKRGIPVQTKETFTEVLETMKQYSIEKNAGQKHSPAF